MFGLGAAEAANCYTVTPENVRPGIAVHTTSSYGPAIVLGTLDRGGFEWFVPVDRLGESTDLFVASILSRNLEKRTVRLRESFDPRLTLVKIVTGDKKLVNSKFPQAVEVENGHPERLAHYGTFRNRAGAPVSYEQLWFLRRGDALRVHFASGKIDQVSLDAEGHCVVRTICSEAEALKSLREGALVQKAPAAAEEISREAAIANLGAGVCITREEKTARYRAAARLLALAEEGTMSWQEVAKIYEESPWVPRPLREELAKKPLPDIMRLRVKFGTGKRLDDKRGSPHSNSGAVLSEILRPSGITSGRVQHEANEEACNVLNHTVCLQKRSRNG